MKQAVLIMAHKNETQIARLINRLGDEFDIFLHLDKKMKLNQKWIDDLLLENKNLFLTDNRISGVIYAWSLVEITLELINTARKIEAKGKYQYSHYILLSGQDYPIIGSNEISIELNTTNNTDYIDLHSSKDTEWIRSLSRRIRFVKLYYIVKRITKSPIIRKLLMIPIYAYQETLTFFLGAPKYKFLKYGFEIYGGSAWWILTKDSIRIITEFYNRSLIKNSTEYKITKAFKRTIGPDESFFHSVLMNYDTDYLSKISPKGNLRYIDWGGLKTKPISQDGSPYVLKLSDLEEIKSSDGIFARKFDIDIDSTILDKLDLNLSFDK